MFKCKICGRKPQFHNLDLCPKCEARKRRVQRLKLLGWVVLTSMGWAFLVMVLVAIARARMGVL